MAPKNRQSVKKKSPSSCPTRFISITQPYISNLKEGKQIGAAHNCKQQRLYCHYGHLNASVSGAYEHPPEGHCGILLPDNKTGNDCPQKSVSQDGSHVAEKVSLRMRNFIGIDSLSVISP